MDKPAQPSPAFRQEHDLPPDFITANWNMATSTDREGDSLLRWGAWESKTGFPAEGSSIEKLLFLNAYVKKLLGREKHPNRNYTRPDMNNYRGWVLNRVLKTLLPSHVRRQGDYILPEDMPKVVDDLNTHRVHHGKMPEENRNIAGFASIEALREGVAPWRPKYPLTDLKRDLAHKRFLMEEGGSGEAVRLGTLENGTEVIHVRTKAAAIAYGSPRWCTTWSEERGNYFEVYEDNLLIVIAASGERWQLYMPTLQFNDDDDAAYNLGTLIQEHPGLEEILRPYAWNEFQNACGRDFDLGYALSLCTPHVSWMAWLTDAMVEEHLQPETDTNLFWRVAEDCLQGPHWRALVKTEAMQAQIAKLPANWLNHAYIGLKVCTKDPEWRSLVPPGTITDALHKDITEYMATYLGWIIKEIVKDDSAWRAELAAPENLHAMVLAVESLKPDKKQKAVANILKAAKKGPQWCAALANTVGGSTRPDPVFLAPHRHACVP